MRYLRAVLALPWVLAAALAVTRSFQRLPLDELPASLARRQPRPPRPVRDPLLLRALVGRLLRWLPPYGMGPCLKRSLILYRLWSLCGLEPRLHLGLREAGRARAFHAWVTAAGRPELSAGGSGFREALVLACRP